MTLIKAMIAMMATTGEASAAITTKKIRSSNIEAAPPQFSP